MRARTALTAILVSSCASATRPAGLARGAPETVGFSAERLARLDGAVERLVAEGAIAGAVVLLARHGRIAHHEAYGRLDVAAGRPMPRDALFRICSMSKAVTSVAAMLLYEEGRFLLDDPVATFLPEFAEPRVLAAAAPEDGSAHATEPAEGPITFRHLLTHTSGITYRFLGEPVIAALYAEAGITDGLAETDLDLAQNVRRIASQPLLHQPGERFTYGLSTDVLGRLVEVISGRSLGEFLEERVFGPLGMVDTGFFVAGDDLERVPTVYRTDKGALEPLTDGPHEEGQLVFSPSFPYRGPRRYESGGAGLVTTAMDYARFCRMLAAGGELDGVRLLSRKTVELMTSDHLASLEPPPGLAFGLGFALAADPGRSGAVPSEGTWSWDGLYTTRFWIDPREDLIGVILTQTFPYNGGRVLDRLVAAAYQAIED